MSLSGEVNKISGDIRRAVHQIAKHGMAGGDGAVIGTKKILGYVCAINTEGELAGTIDVQEYNYEPGEYEIEGAGHHQGVLLSAIQNNNDGVLIVPMMYSEVVIVQNPIDGCEYVLMYSQAQTLQIHAKSNSNKGSIGIGVTEVADFVETDNGLEDDYDELEPTGNKTYTKYTATSIEDSITSADNDIAFTENKKCNSKTITIGNTKVIISDNGVEIETDSEITIKSKSSVIHSDKCEINGGNVTIKGGKLTTKGTSNTDLTGPFNAIKVCPFTGAPHCGSVVSGT